MREVKMNKRRMLSLARFIEKLKPARFDMDNWVYSQSTRFVGKEEAAQCGTTCCVAGWEAVRAGCKLNQFGFVKVGKAAYSDLHARQVAQERLGLTAEQGEELFLAMRGWDIGPKHIKPTPQGAALFIRHMVEREEKKDAKRKAE